MAVGVSSVSSDPQTLSVTLGREAEEIDVSNGGNGLNELCALPTDSSYALSIHVGPVGADGWPSGRGPFCKR